MDKTINYLMRSEIEDIIIHAKGDYLSQRMLEVFKAMIASKKDEVKLVLVDVAE